MSSKATILLTKENEHWYRELNAQYEEETVSEYCIILEIGPGHKVETDEDGTRVIIEEGSPLYNEILKNLTGRR